MATRYQLKQTSNIKLPDLIKCSHCNIKKSQAQYSETRLEDLRQYIIQAGVGKRDFQPKDTGFIRCAKCVGGPAVEHECYHCNITFPRNVLYFSKNMLKNRKDEALCWSCSEREQNDTLSSDESEGSGGGDSGNDSDDTNPFSGHDVRRPLTPFQVTAANKNKVGNLLSIHDRSGSVPVNSSGGTVWGGGSSVASRSITTPSVSDYSGVARIGDDDASSISSFTTPGKKGFNPKNYGDPGLRPSGSVVSSNSPMSKSAWARIGKPASKVHSDAARQLEQTLSQKRITAAKYANDSDVEVAEEAEDSDDDDDEPVVPMPKKTSPARRAQATSTFSTFDFQTFTADNDQDVRGDKLVPRNPPKRQTASDISRQVYGQEEAYHEIATYSDGSLSDDSEDYGGVEVDEGFHG